MGRDSSRSARNVLEGEARQKVSTQCIDGQIDATNQSITDASVPQDAEWGVLSESDASLFKLGVSRPDDRRRGTRPAGIVAA
jgi:hypothetical protein